VTPLRNTTLGRTAARAATLVLVTGLSGAVLGAAAPSAQAATRWHKPALLQPVATTTVTAPTVTADSTSATSAVSAYEAEVLRLVNVERTKRGLRALQASSCAAGFARTWSQRMASTGVFAHQSLSPIMSTCRARGAGENIAYGNVTPAQMIAMWMASTGHRENILRASFTHLGVGAAKTSSGRWYATQDFLTL
jgi:uncharacterized protein YkwD